jgi:hypothetical protein
MGQVIGEPPTTAAEKRSTSAGLLERDAAVREVEHDQ